jgi:hypothetical protein
VTPAQAGIQELRKLLIFNAKMGARPRRHDDAMNLLKPPVAYSA